MAKRLSGLDVLGEVRASMRKLRRIERWLVQCERDEKRRGAKAAERLQAERERTERAKAHEVEASVHEANRSRLERTLGSFLGLGK